MGDFVFNQELHDTCSYYTILKSVNVTLASKHILKRENKQFYYWVKISYRITDILIMCSISMAEGFN